ncbi:MAG: hypothetical protein Fur0042_29650 [Cyanophyceae cyanobacterium]
MVRIVQGMGPHDRQVRLRLGLIIQGDRILQPNQDAIAQLPPQQTSATTNRSGVASSLGSHLNELPLKQFNPLLRAKTPLFNQAFVVPDPEGAQVYGFGKDRRHGTRD